MQFLFELIFEFIPARIWGVLFAAFFIFLGVVVWQSGSEERAKYDAATGPAAISRTGEVRRKMIRTESTAQVNDHDTGSADVNYIEVGYYEDEKYDSVDVRVDRDVYDRIKEGQKMQINFHPDNPAYVVIPMHERPTVIWNRIGAGVLIGVGALLLLIVFFSLF